SGHPKTTKAAPPLLGTATLELVQIFSCNAAIGDAG
ncbi:MAG: hypothetical protein ACI88S_001339, partial [Ilumatobacter sp.]